MPIIYQHQSLALRTLGYAQQRINEIDELVKQLSLERGVMAGIIEAFDPLVCPTCHGHGHVMRYIEGCECDGPRQHKCDRCNGTGKPA